MPKITVHGGPSNFTADFAADWSEDAPEAAADPVEGSESSPGTSTSESSTTSPSRIATSEPSDPGPAPTTELPSKSPLVASSTAGPTDGSTPATGEQDKPPAEDYDTRTVIELRGLLKERGLSTAGSKSDMVQRLQEAIAKTNDNLIAREVIQNL